MRKLLLIASIAFLVSWSLSAQNTISQYEYWFDNNYTSVQSGSTPSTQSYLFAQSINSSSLSTGFHSAHIHFKDGNNLWSVVLSQSFYKAPQGLGNGNVIVQYEYWFDNDYTNRVSTTISSVPNANINIPLSASTLATGLHAFHIRFEDASNTWSSPTSQFFYKAPLVTQPNLVIAYRYWFDNNGGVPTNVTLGTPTPVENIITNINCSSLSQGVHTIHFQFQDVNSLWSEVTNDAFTVIPGGGNYSCVQPFLQFPSDGASDIATQTHFQWEAVPGINITYDLDVRQPSAITADISETGLTQTRFEYTAQLNTATSYQWKVRAWINGNATSWSNINTFIIRDVDPSSGWGSPLGQFNDAIVYSNIGDNCNSCAHPGNNPPSCPDPCATQSGVTTGLRWQCVEFVDRYYKQVYGLDVYAAGLSGNANTYLGHASGAGILRFKNINPEQPRTGDILVWNGTNINANGHVAVVQQMVGNVVTILQQNAGMTWTNTITLSQDNNGFWRVPVLSSVGVCLGWIRPQPTCVQPYENQVVMQLNPLFNWNNNPNQNNNLIHNHTLLIYQKDITGCYQPYLTQTAISAPQVQLNQPLQAGKDYSYRLISVTPSGTVTNPMMYFSVSPNAHALPPVNDFSRANGNDSTLYHTQIHTYQMVDSQELVVCNARVYIQQKGSWTDFEFSDPNGNIFVNDLFPGITVGDSIFATANGFTSKYQKVTVDNITSGIIAIQLDLISGTDLIYDPALVAYVNGIAAENPYLTQANVQLHITAVNHNYYQIASFGENDDSSYYENHAAADSIVDITLLPGINSLTIRFVNTTDTIFYLSSITYIPEDSVATSTYKVTIAPNPLNTGVSMYVNGNFSKTLGPFEDSVKVPLGTNYFAFVQVGYDNFNATTVRADTIYTLWQQFIPTAIKGVPDDGISLSLYPNPCDKQTSLYYSLTEPSVVSIKLFNLIGNEISLIQNQTQNSGFHHYTIDASNLSSGLYIYQLSVNKKAIFSKLIVAH